MKLYEHLDERTKRKLNYSNKDKGKHQPRKRKRKKRKQERLTEYDIKELMGTNRPKYSKHRGAYRQR